MCGRIYNGRCDFFCSDFGMRKWAEAVDINFLTLKKEIGIIRIQIKDCLIVKVKEDV